MLAGFVGLAVLVTDDDDEKKTPAPTPTVGVLPPAPFAPGLPFAEPPAIRSREIGGRPTLKTELVARNGSIEVSGVPVAGAQSYLPKPAVSPQPPGLLGPTLHVEPGGRIDLVLDNQLTVPPGIAGNSAETCGGAGSGPAGGAHAHGSSIDTGPQFTNLHFHGLHVTPTTRDVGGVQVYGDNVLLNLPKGRSRFEFDIPSTHPQGTFWYHAHRHGCTDDQVYRGLAGLLIIGDSREELPPPLRNLPTRSLALKDIQVEESPPDSDDYAIPADHDWVNPTHRTVNGLVNPTLEMNPRETQLWRVANVSSAVWYEVALVDPKADDARDVFTVVAQDGNTLERAQDDTSVLLGPGHRVDILARAPASGTRVLKTLPFNQGRRIFPEDVLATMEVRGAPRRPAPEPARLDPVISPFPPRKGEDRTFVFDIVPTKTGGVNFTINGKVFDPKRVDADPVLGTTETWTLLNNSSEWHPFHIHQDDFRVKSVNGQPADYIGPQDVVGLPPKQGEEQGSVVIEMPFKDFDGDFVFHCHILDHEDGGMMARVDVSP